MSRQFRPPRESHRGSLRALRHAYDPNVERWFDSMLKDAGEQSRSSDSELGRLVLQLWASAIVGDRLDEKTDRFVRKVEEKLG